MNPSASAPIPGSLMIRGVRCTADGQLLLVDLVAHTDLAPAARSDDMADAVDIADLVSTTRDLVGGPPGHLLEALVVRCAEALLARFPRIDAIEVRIAKPDPPGLDAAEEVVEVTLARAGR